MTDSWAGLLDVEPTADAVHAARRERGLDSLTREVVERGNFKTWLIDTGYGAETTYRLEEDSARSPRAGSRRCFGSCR